MRTYPDRVDDVAVRVVSAVGDSESLVLRAAEWRESPYPSYDGPDVRVELRCGSLRAAATLPATIADPKPLAAFFAEIDREWRGWSGWRAADLKPNDWLSLSAASVGHGRVDLRVTLAEGWPLAAAWTATATLGLDVGSAQAAAAALAKWGDAVWPERGRPARSA